MILVITNKSDITADYLIVALKKRRIPFYRFNSEDFPRLLQVELLLPQGKIFFFPYHNRGKKIELGRIKSVWYRLPGDSVIPTHIMSPSHREFAGEVCQVTLENIWKAIDCLWMNHPDAIKASARKIAQLKLANELGFLIPDTMVTTDPSKSKKFYATHAGRVIVKTLQTRVPRLLKRNKSIYTQELKLEDFTKINGVRYCPTLFQEKIEKQADVRVTVVGEKVFAAKIHSQDFEDTMIDWRRNRSHKLVYSVINLPKTISNRCVKMVKQLNLIFGAMDLILTPQGEYIFLELNANGQWGWIEERTGLPIRDAIINTLNSGKKY